MRSYGWLLAALVAPWLGETDGLPQRAPIVMSSPSKALNKPPASSRVARGPGLQPLPPAAPLRIFDPRDPLASTRTAAGLPGTASSPLVLPEISSFNKPGLKGVEELGALFLPTSTRSVLSEIADDEEEEEDYNDNENDDENEDENEDDEEEEEGLAALERQWQAEWEREAAAEGSSSHDEDDEDEEDEDEEGGSAGSGIGLEVLPSSRAPPPPAGPAPTSLVIYYLQTELRLSEATLMKVILKHSWVMYLKVDSNLRPTVAVLRSFGFRAQHVRSVVSSVPSVLAINCQWTLPEKLLSLQRMFGLSRPQLVRLCCRQPLLLTSSIERNMRVADFLSGAVGLTQEQLRALLQACPRVAMTGLPVLRACWGVLTGTYGLSPKQARAAVRRCPQLLTRQLLARGLDRLHFFSKEMGVRIGDGDGSEADSVPSALFLNTAASFSAAAGGVDREAGSKASGSSTSSSASASAKSLALRCPALLYLDTDIFLRPNLAILRRHLSLDDAALRKMVSVFPQLLTHNPATLERACVSSLWLLTGLKAYKDGAEGSEELDGMDGMDEIGRQVGAVGVDLIGDIAEGVGGANRSAFTTKSTASSTSDTRTIKSSPAGTGGSIGGTKRKLLRLSQRARSRLDSANSAPLSSSTTSSTASATAPRADPAALLRQLSCPLALSLPRAQHTLASCPWILSYRPERTRGVLATLAVTLGMTRMELTHCVSVYPRLLSLATGAGAGSLNNDDDDNINNMSNDDDAPSDAASDGAADDMPGATWDETLEGAPTPSTTSTQSTASAGAAGDGKIRLVLRALAIAASQIHSDTTAAAAAAAAANAAAVAAASASAARAAANAARVGGIRPGVVIAAGAGAASPPPLGAGAGVGAGAGGLGSVVRQCHSAKSLADAARGDAELTADALRLSADANRPRAEILGASADDEGVSAALAGALRVRRGAVRSMVRAAVLRYPLILGTGMSRIEARLAELRLYSGAGASVGAVGASGVGAVGVGAAGLQQHQKRHGNENENGDGNGNGNIMRASGSGSVGVAWPDVVNFIRRGEGAQQRWRDKRGGG